MNASTPSLRVSDPEDRSLVESAVDADARLVKAARRDFCAFTAYTMRDEMSGKPLQQGWLHLEWNRLRRKHKNLVIIGFVGSGKSTQLTNGLPLYRLGRNHRERLLIAGAVVHNAAHTVRANKRMIEQNEDLRRVFPTLKPGEKWEQSFFDVERPSYIRHPSVQAIGLGSRIQGNRVDGLIGDDVVDDENSRTKAARDGSYRWFTRSVLSRTHPVHSWKVIIGNAWHPDDLHHRLQRDGWPMFVFPALATQEFIDQGLPHPRTGNKWSIDEPLWPEYWPVEAVEAKRAELNNPIEFARQVQCRPRDDTTAKFKEAWIELALKYGEGCPLCTHHSEVMDEDEPPVLFAIGFDPASGRKTGDNSALVVLGLYADGDRRVLEVNAGKWDIYEQGAQIVSAWRRWYHPVNGPPLVGVENVGVQQWLVKILTTETAAGIVPLHTGKNKADPRMGIEVIGHEMANQKWIIPSQKVSDLYDTDGNRVRHLDDDVAALVHDMQYYVPDPNVHTGDRLMAAWFAWRILTDLESRLAPSGDEGVTMRVIGGGG